jgi:aminoglycoside 3-N-acetyltransferase I
MNDSLYQVRQLGPADVELMEGLLDVFGEAFDDLDSYARRRPRRGYLERLLGREHFVALVALRQGVVVGGLAAYELEKFEQERSEIYIYDLAVAEAHRRQGLATGLIRELQRIAAERGAWVIYVQADLVDAPAVALYTKLGTREDVLHFDIDVGERPERPAGAWGSGSAGNSTGK